MTAAAREWLPKEAFTAEAVSATLSGPLLDWSQRWFVDARVAVSLVTCPANKERPAQGIEITGKSAKAVMPGHGKRRLLEAALGAGLSGKVLSESDHKILDALAVDAMKELLSTLDELSEKSDSESVAISATLCLASAELATISLPAHGLVRAVKAMFGTPRAADTAPKELRECLKPVELMTEAVLGRADLALQDVRELAAGDVVLLDRSLRDLVELRLSSGRQQIGRGKLGRLDGRVCVQF